MEGGGGGWYRPPMTGVWWDINTCPVPADVDPRYVRQCIVAGLEKQIRRPTKTIIYAMGNLEYISSDILEKIASSGIILIHAPCGANHLIGYLHEWCDDEKLQPQRPGSRNIMVISGDGFMSLCIQEFSEFNKFCAYPKDVGPLTIFGNQREKVFVKEFVWETLCSYTKPPSGGYAPVVDKPLCICQVCDAVYHTCNDFITHLKSQQHREGLFGIAARGGDGNMPRFFCTVCNYPAYDEFNMSLHNESKDHKQKLAEKEPPPPQAEDCEREQEEKSTSGSL